LEALIRQKEDIEIKLVRADKLTGGLVNESKRWKESVETLKDDMVNLMGNMIIAAGYQSYVGVFTNKYRQ
jgi:dynein heavy chain